MSGYEVRSVAGTDMHMSFASLVRLWVSTLHPVLHDDKDGAPHLERLRSTPRRSVEKLPTSRETETLNSVVLLPTSHRCTGLWE